MMITHFFRREQPHLFCKSFSAIKALPLATNKTIFPATKALVAGVLKKLWSQGEKAFVAGALKKFFL
jgi:hypothetical protein